LDGFVPRLAAVYAGLFVAMGVQLPFLPLWFAAKGLDSPAIGMVLAVATAVRLMVVPLATHATDRAGGLKGAIVLAALAACAGYAALAFGEGVAALLVVYALASAAVATLLPLLETYAVQGLKLRQRAYGPVRLWASVAFMAGTLIAGALTPLLGAADIIWIIVAAYFGCCLLTPRLLPLGLPEPNKVSPHPETAHLPAAVMILAVAAASCLQASHAFYYAFSALEWRAGGISSLSIGLLWSFGVVAEIALFAASARFPAWIAPTHLLIAGALGGVVRWTAMAFDPSAILLTPLQGLHALSFGATHLGAVLLIARAAPLGLAATAQGLLATAIGLTTALALLASGFLRPDWGNASYAAMALLAVLGLACAFAAHATARAALTPKAPGSAGS
jgi:PPP family 3-phenylpropionic acid transporter